MLSKLAYSNCYNGSVTIQFSLDKQSEHIFVDFVGKVQKMMVSGKETWGYFLRDNRIYFRKEILKIGENEITIFFENVYKSSAFEFDQNVN